MILVNRNFGNPALSQAIGDMFKASSDVGQNVSWVHNTNTLAASSTLVSTQDNICYLPGGNGGSNAPICEENLIKYNNYNSMCNNFYLVTEHFLKTLDKVYSKIWNESFVETGIYVPANLATMFHGFVIGAPLNSSNTDFMIFKKFVDRCITAGVLLEEDRLDYKDQIFLSGMSRSVMSTQIDLPNKLITMTSPNPIDVTPDIDARVGTFHEGKKLFLFMTPYLTNESVAKNNAGVSQEPFYNSGLIRYYRVVGGTGGYTTLLDTPVKQPIAFFKPKTSASKFGRSLPLASHFAFSIGSEADKEAALIAGTPTPDIVVDHTDRISHIDSLVLKIKFDKLQF